MKKIDQFKCPRWNDLPTNGIRSSEVIGYVENILNPISLEDPILTATMIQNYRRWGLLSKKEGRLYYKEDIAKILVICVYKQILTIEEVKKGIKLSLQQLSVEESYDTFAETLETCIKSISDFVKNKKDLNIYDLNIEGNKAGLSVIAYAYAMKLLGSTIIQADGLKNLRRRIND